MITAPKQVVFYAPVSLRNFDFMTQPVIGGATAESYRGDDIADGGQTLNMMDAKVRRFVTAHANLAVNPQFKTDTVWVKGAGWTIAEGKPGLAVYTTQVTSAIITQPGIVISSNDYVVIVKCTKYTSGTITPQLGTASDGGITSVGTTVHQITANGVDARMLVTGSAGAAEFEYMYVLDSDAYQFALALSSRQVIDSAVIDGHNMLDAFPASVERSMKVYHNTVDNFSTSSEVAVNEYVSGLFGKNAPALDGDGVDDLVNLTGLGNELSIYAGSIEIEFTPKELTTNNYMFAVTGQRIYIYTSGTTLTIILGDNVAKSIQQVVLDTRYHVVLTWAGIADGSGTFFVYVNGVQAGTGTYTGLTAIGADPQLFAVASTNNAQAVIYTCTPWNKALTAGEALARFNGDEIAIVDRWGKKLISAWTNKDFDTFTSSGANITQAVSGAAGDNCFSAIDPVAGSTVRARFILTMNAGSASDLKARSASDDALTADVNINTTLVAGVNDISFTALSTDAFFGIIDAVGSVTKADFAVSAFEFIEEGAVAEYDGEGISSDQASWFDNGSNVLTGSIVGAVALNAPDSSNLGYYLMRFDEVVDNLYWYLSINEDTDLPVALQKFGQMLFMKQYLFDITATQEFSGALDNSGVDVTQTVSGVLDATRNYESGDEVLIPIDFQGRAGWNQMQEFIDVVGGREMSFYTEVLPLDPLDQIIRYRMRLSNPKVPFKFVFGNDVPWRVVLAVKVDL